MCACFVGCMYNIIRNLMQNGLFGVLQTKNSILVFERLQSSHHYAENASRRNVLFKAGYI